MKLSKITKTGLFLFAMYWLFPTFDNGLIVGIIQVLFYLLLLYISYVAINTSVNYIIRNWSKAHLRYIDEREHIKGNTLANLTRLDFLGATFRLFHYVRYNKKRILTSMWYSYLENMAIVLTFVIGVIIIVGFIFFSLKFA